MTHTVTDAEPAPAAVGAYVAVAWSCWRARPAWTACRMRCALS